ncbi:hypothetical protein ACG1BZ_06710 [Microbulbifer sp. CNSA002]|uniref:hypothetical protein n=1 Tax=Microbulbifer sp. CNSA002 TaxID=3373604 RepID=UPI0039B6E34C
MEQLRAIALALTLAVDIQEILVVEMEAMVMVGVKSLNKHILFAAIAVEWLTPRFTRCKCECYVNTL